MPRHIAFLRAINVGGHTVKMDRLRGLFEDLSLANVETVIASGNVLFDSKAKAATLEARIERHLQAELGYAVDTFIRSPAELEAILAHDPFARSTQRTPESGLYIGFLKATPRADVCRSLDGCLSPVDEFRIHARELYWSVNGGFSDSKFFGASIEKRLAGSTTIRNVTTVRRIAALVA
ncbi:MAG: DUF1697 domain-containing protein [Gemmatimonadaceae bacterium]